MQPYQRRFLVIIVAEAVAIGMFWLFLRLSRPGWETSEYPFIILYSLPLGALVLLCNWPVRRLRSRPALYVGAAIFSSIGAAIAWTAAALFLTGGYLLAADANPLWCWAAAALVATAVNLGLQSVRAGRASSSQAAV
jgi:hypothetical protein